MVNDYNHGRSQEEEGFGMEEYDMPPEPPIPEPIIPTAMYYELPAGLMAPLVGVSGTTSRLACKQTLYLGLTRDLFWARARSGRERIGAGAS